jgi:hypothetical protein
VARLIAANGNTALKVIGPPSAAGTVAITDVTATAATVNGSSSTLTVSSVTVPAYVTDSIIAPGDGAHVPTTIVCNQTGVRVTDLDGTSKDSFANELLLQGGVVSASVSNLPADASTRAWIATQFAGRVFFDFSL